MVIGSVRVSGWFSCNCFSWCFLLSWKQMVPIFSGRWIVWVEWAESRMARSHHLRSGCETHLNPSQWPVGWWSGGLKLGLPSGTQTWRAGKWTIEIGDFPSCKPPFSYFPVSHVWLPQRVNTIKSHKIPLNPIKIPLNHRQFFPMRFIMKAWSHS